MATSSADTFCTFAGAYVPIVASPSSEELAGGEEMESGVRIGSYQVRSQRGAGPDGTLYFADDPQGRSVELHVLSGAAAQPARWRDIAGRLRLVQHLDHCVHQKPRECALDHCPPFVVSPGEGVDGNCLHDVLEGEMPLSLWRRLQMASELTSCLAEAHALGLAHENLTPTTVRLSPELAPQLDFCGLRTASVSSEEQALLLVAPGEECSEDVRRLAQIIDSLLRDEFHPDEQNGLKPRRQRATKPPTKPPEGKVRALPARQRAGLRRLLRQAVEVDPLDRPSAREIQAALESLVSASGVSTALATPTAPVECHSPALEVTVEAADRPVIFQGDEQPSHQSELAFDDTSDTTGNIEKTGDDLTSDGDETGEIDAENEAPSPKTPEAAGDPPAIRRLVEVRPGERLGRYRILRKIGQGGMGAVFEAEDIAQTKRVAVKTLSAGAGAGPRALRRFHKEARLLAAVNNPYVANLLEVNEDRGVHFLVMEYVDGVTVKQLLQKKGPLPEKAALTILADVARALVDAHQQGIVHRDIKPDNILLAAEGEDPQQTGPQQTASPQSSSNSQSNGKSLTEHDQSLTGKSQSFSQIKLADFGIARHIDQSASLAVTRAGALLGTPTYMSPEQCKGRGEVSPQSDVYGMGVTLYELLVGRPPFSADDPLKLAGMHCFDAPPALEKQRADLSGPLVQLVNKTLAKHPADRHADAGHFLREAERLLHGEPSAAAVHPLLPEHQPARLFQADFSWEMESSVEELWPYVSNTERLNRAVGLPPVVYRTRIDPEKGVRKFGSFRLGGVTIQWEEHPFEWIEGKRMGVLREFSRGPFRWFLSVVELARLPGGGTQLSHQVRIDPRNTLGRVMAEIEVKWKGRRSLSRVYRRIDETLCAKTKTGARGKGFADPFEGPPALSKTRRTRLGKRLDKLKSLGVRTELAERLGAFLAEAPPQEIARIRPLVLANQWNAPQEDVLQACLLAAVEGLLVLQWDILCPTCRVPSDVQTTLREITRHSYCEACNLDFELNLAGSVELVFRAHDEIRQADAANYCIGGPENAPHVAAQLRIAPGERMELELELPPGEYLLRGPQLPYTLPMHVLASGAPTHAEIRLHPSLPQQSTARRNPSLRAGKQLLSLENGHAALMVVRVERTLPRSDVVTAAEACSMSLFRELFPQQVLRSGQLMSAQTVTLLAVAIANADDWYEQLGDAQAYEVLQEIFSVVEQEVQLKHGAVVKSLGDSLIASFSDAADAVAAAIDLPQSIQNCKQGPNELSSARAKELRLNRAVHQGAALVTTQNDRLDYFGAAMRTAMALPQFAHRGDFLMTEAVFSDPAVAELIPNGSHPTRIEKIDLPGRPGCLIQRASWPMSLQGRASEEQ